MDAQVATQVCQPQEGKVFPGTWPDCPYCHGHGYPSTNETTTSCQTCQTRSAEIIRSLSDLISFDYYGRPKKMVRHFYREGEEVESPWIDISWANVHGGTGVPLGTWPDCSHCNGLGTIRYDIGWDGHRYDYAWQDCRVCQPRTKEYHDAHPNEKDVLLLMQAAERRSMQRRHQAEIETMQQRHQAELEALPY